MWLVIGIIVFVLVAAYILFKKPKEKDDGYGEYIAPSDSLWEKAKEACCSRMR